jgi:hypothetical protein
MDLVDRRQSGFSSDSALIFPSILSPDHAPTQSYKGLLPHLCKGIQPSAPFKPLLLLSGRNFVLHKTTVFMIL